MRQLRRWRTPLVSALIPCAVLAAVLLRPTRAGHWKPPAQPAIDGALMLPKEAGSVRFAVIGDAGRGDARQYDTAEQMVRWRGQFPFDFVLMLGDNIYGPGTPEDLALRFDRPYRALIEQKVMFRAVLGNHDPPATLTYPPLGMNGQRYYSFTETGGLPLHRSRTDFFAIDTLDMDGPQLQWLGDSLEKSKADWKIAFYHHPLYTSGDYTWRAARIRARLESIFISGGVDVGFSGHEHFYERVIPQQGVQYFTSGAGGALREGHIRPSSVIATGFDGDTHFMLVEIAGDTMYFQTISRTGHTVDYGTVSRDPDDRLTPSIGAP